ncbi:hypothetical protein ANOM_000343 [Aspergillus nomiae NRRL 13137]|uniref:Fungal specific transcription factor n=1 Tax=Aspergillus nomiae NRRL (strain ATCC 15546 / NRRL 13137 / CBS 260.88 / M93) TaxID=1509407 RepID=A0A0L1JHS0_ASPN3|nr:uncharacterized protein ANOM_000343 [Aspergillus nomiae NRRL 13137]KNG91314.1 hypothetical protein ANOM_000343 [Aspergillus nomiae NRRL 13137]
MPSRTTSTLLESRWAPRPEESKTKRSSSTSRGGNHPAPSQELARFMKIVGRLKWKLPFLAEGYRLATLPADGGVDVAHAEIMFKIDFFEYYALLERAIVHLLGVFGVTVTGAFTRSHSTPRLGRNGSPVATHRYHANVLDTLESESCPLHPVLGTGNVREQLRKAKELRNRWKTADMSKEETENDSFRRPRETAMPLESYDFDHILSEIFVGLEDGLALAREHVAKIESDTGDGLSGDSEADWDFIVDAMDWEAV